MMFELFTSLVVSVLFNIAFIRKVDALRAELHGRDEDVRRLKSLMKLRGCDKGPSQ